ncbi:MAG: regulatory protein GemA [Desulfobacteraceae bacterium]|nr:regulatory protein GemA [Desulfobacteraceae bacterium]
MNTITKKQIQYLQVLRRKAGLDDDTWTAMKAEAGAVSTRDLTEAQFNRLLARLEGRPAETSVSRRPKPGRPVHASARKSGMHTAPPMETAAMLGKIEAILADLKLPWSYADGMARKMFGVQYLKWCRADQVYKLLQALIVHQNRSRKP